MNNTLKILVVDDDEIDRMALRRMMAAVEPVPELHEAADGASALQLLASRNVDCIFLDYHMPGQSGLDVLLEIRAQNLSAPVVMLTGAGNEGLAVDLLQAGATDYLPKSQLSIESARHALERAIRIHRAEAGRKQAEQALAEKQRMLSVLADNVPGMVFRGRMDDGRRMVVASRGARELLDDQYELFKKAGRRYEAVIHPEDLGLMRSVLDEAVAQRTAYQMTYRLRSDSGTSRWVSEQGSVVYSEQEQAVYLEGIVGDVTERKQYEQVLQARNEELAALKISLEARVEERTEALQQANEALSRLNQAKSEFLSIVSHELRTPLTSIKSFAEILLDDIEDVEPETARSFLTIIDTESDRLARLISDLLDLQKIDAGKMKWNDDFIDLGDVVRRTTKVFEGACKEKKLTLQVDITEGAGPMMADADKLQQVMSNLLSNAVKYTNEGTIRVALAAQQHEGMPFVQVSVHDSGSGVPADQVEKIFERFFQVEGQQPRTHRGTGLGLGICKEIVDHYQGRIWAESEPGQGSVFTFELPVAVDALPDALPEKRRASR